MQLVISIITVSVFTAILIVNKKVMPMLWPGSNLIQAANYYML